MKYDISSVNVNASVQIPTAADDITSKWHELNDTIQEQQQSITALTNRLKVATSALSQMQVRR